MVAIAITPTILAIGPLGISRTFSAIALDLSPLAGANGALDFLSAATACWMGRSREPQLKHPNADSNGIEGIARDPPPSGECSIGGQALPGQGLIGGVPVPSQELSWAIDA